MTIGEYIRQTDRKEYNKLMSMFKGYKKEPFATVEIRLGCSVEELMSHDSYRKVKGRIRQKK